MTEMIAQPQNGVEGENDTGPTTPEQCDERASWLLRALASVQLQLNRRKAVHEAELENLRAYQARQLEALLRSQADLTRRVEELAQLAAANEWFGKAKSRSVSYGTYGTRFIREKVAIADEKKAIAWASEKCPEAVKITEKVMISACSGILLADMHETGELPEGFEHVPGTVKPYAVADVAVLAAGGDEGDLLGEDIQ